MKVEGIRDTSRRFCAGAGSGKDRAFIIEAIECGDAVNKSAEIGIGDAVLVGGGGKTENVFRVIEIGNYAFRPFVNYVSADIIGGFCQGVVPPADNGLPAGFRDGYPGWWRRRKAVKPIHWWCHGREPVIIIFQGVEKSLGIVQETIIDPKVDITQTGIGLTIQADLPGQFVCTPFIRSNSIGGITGIKVAIIATNLLRPPGHQRAVVLTAAKGLVELRREIVDVLPVQPGNRVAIDRTVGVETADT